MAGPDVVIDGEVVALAKGVSSFARLQGRMKLEDPEQARSTGIAVAYSAFDLPWLDGRDTSELPLRERKALLRQTLAFEDPIRFTPIATRMARRFSRRRARRAGRA